MGVVKRQRPAGRGLRDTITFIHEMEMKWK